MSHKYLGLYGRRYICDHPVYNSCTLFEIGEKGLAAGCRACGGPYPNCKLSCKLFDD